MSNMQVVLLERVEHLGNLGDVVAVKPGYARNYLLPQAKALRATKNNLALFEKSKADLEAANAAKRGEAEKIAKTLEGKSFVLIRQASEAGHLYGSVSNRDIADSLAEAKHDVVRNQVRLNQAIKTLGLFQIPIMLHPEVPVTVTVNIARSNEEAEIQAKTGKAVIKDNSDEDEKPAKKADASSSGEQPEQAETPSEEDAA